VIATQNRDVAFIADDFSELAICGSHQFLVFLLDAPPRIRADWRQLNSSRHVNLFPREADIGDVLN
jgi:hypothetical protein